MDNKDFYRAFEDKYRGSRELIKSRVSVYLPFILPLKEIYPDASALDIGCGRGEWLELLKEHNITANGIDLDSGMLLACKEFQLNVQQGNGIAHLKELDDESLTSISAFHVVEHISFEDLQLFVKEALRVLKPGGLLVLETPNPENIKVATENFYLDPTHIRPIPSGLLSFLPEFHGYKRTKVLRLQESKALASQKNANLFDVLAGASPDYAVIAQKDAKQEILKSFDEVFNKEYGLSLDDVFLKFENRLVNIEAKANDALNLYNMLVNSTSWRLTYPLRLVANSVRALMARLKSRMGLVNGFAKRLFASSDVAERNSFIYKPEKCDVTPVIVADMYVLAQGVKTGVHRVCDELFRRLSSDKRVCFSAYLEGCFVEKGENILRKDYLECLEGKSAFSLRVCADTFFVSPFGVANYDIIHAKNLRHVHFIYDLIAINNPEYFTHDGAEEVKEIVASLTKETIIFAISEHTKREILEYRKDLEPDQITVVPLAADKRFCFVDDEGEKERVCNKYGIPFGAPYALSLATLEVRKNIETVVEAYNNYLNNNPDSTLNLVLSGMKGWKLEKLQKKLAKYVGIKDRVIFTGFVDEEDLSVLYSNAMVFVYMSRSEGFGLPPLEAMACGLPVVTSNNSSLPEVVGDAGYMFDCDDYKSVAMVMKDLYEDVTLRSKLSSLAITRSKLFDWDKTVDIIVSRLEKESHKKIASWPDWKDFLEFKGRKIEGGLRLRGSTKRSQRDKPLVSYVTVVWNNEKDIRRTIESVQMQTYGNVEHIILDGGSTDNTLAIVQEYESVIDYYASEEDAGLYDALNKAIPLCRGELICVLNSDDWLPVNAAKKIVDSYKGNKKELILGAAKVEVSDSNVIVWSPEKVSLSSYMSVANCCHNAIYATRGAYKAGGSYDISYSIAADFKWIMSCYDADVHFNYVDFVAVNYSLGGLSSDGNKHIKEVKKVMGEKFPFLSDEEVSVLNYAYYTWRKKLNHSDYEGVDIYTNIEAIANKYAFSKEFQEAMPKMNRRLLMGSRLKKMLKKFPALYKLIQKVYYSRYG